MFVMKKKFNSPYNESNNDETNSGKFGVKARYIIIIIVSETINCLKYVCFTSLNVKIVISNNVLIKIKIKQ